MDIITSYRDIPSHLKGAAAAIGNFDGLHSGHMMLIDKAGALAEAYNLPWGVISFEPHPRTYFKPDTDPFRLTPLEAKAEILSDKGVDVLYALPFDTDLASMPGQTFIDEVLTGVLGIAHLVTGEDFAFGKGRDGDVALLTSCPHFQTHVIAPVCNADGQRHSSSRIRSLLQAGEISKATEALGRPYSMTGTVVHGDARGREIGFPTANLDLGDYLRPARGIYAVNCIAEDGQHYGGAASFGIRPSFEGESEVFEVHLFDCNADLYGQSLAVTLVAYLREERRYDSVDALTAQIAEDCNTARCLLASST